jgi:site-specific DNA recombinase
MLSLTTFADELEREKARQRTYDAMIRKARAGHVTGGRLFGYDNVRLESHVERGINETEAAVVRQIFDLSIQGYGIKAITKRLNAEGAPSPQAQQGRSQTWSPSSVRAVLYRDIYRGRVTWNKTRKRNQWGIKKQAARPAGEWLERPAPKLQIVPDDVWEAAHARLAAVRGVYLKATNGQAFGRPPLGDPSKYLLTNLALCGQCGCPLYVTSRRHGKGRKKFYGCSGYHERGICQNVRDVPMTDADEIVSEALLDDVLDQHIVNDSIDEALRLLQGDDERAPTHRRVAAAPADCWSRNPQFVSWTATRRREQLRMDARQDEIMRDVKRFSGCDNPAACNQQSGNSYAEQEGGIARFGHSHDIVDAEIRPVCSRQERWSFKEDM